MINPESEIGWWSRSHLEIDWDSLDDMPTFVRFWEDAGLADLLRDYILVAHNANGADIHHITSRRVWLPTTSKCPRSK